MKDKTQKEKFQHKLKEMMAKKGLRSEQLAVEMKISNATVLSWLSGRRSPNFVTAQYIEKKYGVKIS